MISSAAASSRSTLQSVFVVAELSAVSLSRSKTVETMATLRG